MALGDLVVGDVHQPHLRLLVPGLAAEDLDKTAGNGSVCEVEEGEEEEENMVEEEEKEEEKKVEEVVEEQEEEENVVEEEEEEEEVVEDQEEDLEEGSWTMNDMLDGLANMG